MSSKNETVYPAQTPTIIVTAETPSGKVVTTLYGEVSPERKAKEQAAAEYRALQLTPLPQRRQTERREFYPRLDKALRDADEFTGDLPRRLRGRDRDRERVYGR